MKIGIWGLYSNGNFGDDLMALMFKSYIEEQGHEPSVFNVSDFLKEEISCRTFKSIDEFVNYNDFVVIGGGGMLVNNSLLKFLLKKNEFYFETSFYKLLSSLKKYNKKLIPLSIGGANSNYLNNPSKKSLFSSKWTIGGTVRLPSDLNLVDSALFEYIPDVVLATSHFYSPKESAANTGKKRLVLNLKNKSAGPLLDAFKKANIFDTFDVYSFQSHATSLSHIGSYEYELPGRSFNFNTISEGVDFLKKSDIVISSKLHVGVTALSFGNPFISFMGPSKAKEFLKNSGQSDCIIDDPLIIVEKLLSNDFGIISNETLQKQKQLSLGHFEKLNHILKKL